MKAYESLRQRAVRTAHEGRLEEAENLFSQALAAARELGDPELGDRAYCNLAAVQISRGEWDGPRTELRRILTRSPGSPNAFLAAYNLARAYELSKDVKKGLFYARIARDRAQSEDQTEWRVAARHQVANLLVADSQFREAREEYHAALSLLDSPEAVDDQHEAWINLAYCDLMRGATRRALDHLYRRLRRVRREGLKRLEALVRQDLALALLEVARPDLSVRHSSRALELARNGEADVEKNCLFLLAEGLEARGNQREAFRVRQRLQQRFYPEQPNLAEVLSQVNVRRLVNLRA